MSGTLTGRATHQTHAQTLYGDYKYIQYSFDLYRQKALIMQGRHASRGRQQTAFKHHPRGENQRARGRRTPPGPARTPPPLPLFASRPADSLLFIWRGRHQAAAGFYARNDADKMEASDQRCGVSSVNQGAVRWCSQVCQVTRQTTRRGINYRGGKSLLTAVGNG